MKRRCLFLVLAVLDGCGGQGPAPDYGRVNERLDQSRAGIFPPLGATVSTLDRERLQDQPGGENQPLSETLARLPGVTVGTGGQLRVRGQ